MLQMNLVNYIMIFNNKCAVLEEKEKMLQDMFLNV